MEKLNAEQISNVLKDVRASYRLLALYQKRLLDIVKYSANVYNLSFNSGWSKFSKQASHGNRANIEASSWHWLSLYLYEFNLGGIEIGVDKYNLKIVHQADTGYYDVAQDKKVSPDSIEEFADTSISSTRLFFILSKNDYGCPIQHVLKGNLKSKDNSIIKNGNWLAIPYPLERFSSQMSTDDVLNDFNKGVKNYFDVDLVNINTEVG